MLYIRINRSHSLKIDQEKYMVLDHTEHEITTQTEAWHDAHLAVKEIGTELTTLWERGGFDHIVVTGCGSTYYLSMIAANLLQSSTGVITRAVPASELLLHPEAVYGRRGRPLLVAISRSGATTETIKAVQAFKDQYHGDVIVISVYDDKPLNALATLNLAANSGQEVSIAQTRSFSAMLIMAEGIARSFDGRPYDVGQFPASTHEWVETAHNLAAGYADPDRFQRVFYLGSGALYGLACEAMLKMKEMSLTNAEAFHTLEFRHGPKSMVDSETLVVGLLDGRSDSEMAVIDEMRQLGATTVTLSWSDTVGADIILKDYNSRPSLVHYMPFLQWLAYERAVRKGLNPDTPRNLDQVVIL
jgi:glutamine---fructose-6-phosphate transaminase (isomerizing)